MGYKRWRPNSRRDRRRKGRRSSRKATEGADRTLLLIIGFFLLITLVAIAALAFFAG